MKRKYSAFVLLFGILFVPVMALQSAGESFQLKKTEITFLVKHPFKDVHGVCKKITVSNQVIIGEGKRFSATLPLQVQIDVDQIRTGNRNRDSHMLEVLEYPKFKTITATVKSIRAKSETEYEISGDLTIKGSTKPFTATARVKAEGNQVDVSGKIEVRFTDFKVERPALLMLAVEDIVTVDFHLHYVR